MIKMIDTMSDEELRRAIAEALGVDLDACPDWPRDVATALELMTPGATLARVDPKEWPGAWECYIDIWYEDDTMFAYADTPARAMCRAWLMWKERERL